MAICLAVPVLLDRPKQVHAQPAADDAPITLERTLHDSVRPLSLGGAAVLVTVAAGTLWAAGALARVLPFFPAVLWLTTIALLLGQIPAIKRLAGGALFGNYLILLFLASNGAESVIARLVAQGPPVFYFAVLTVAVHGLVIFGLGRLVRLDWGTLAVASQANVGGPASALAMAGARGYADLIVPGVAVGLLGYAIGNYLGFLVGTLMRGIL